jgi:hypothetical protein
MSRPSPGGGKSTGQLGYPNPSLDEGTPRGQRGHDGPAQLGSWLYAVWDPLGMPALEALRIQNPVNHLDHAKRELAQQRSSRCDALQIMSAGAVHADRPAARQSISEGRPSQMRVIHLRGGGFSLRCVFSMGLRQVRSGSRGRSRMTTSSVLGGRCLIHRA